MTRTGDASTQLSRCRSGRIGVWIVASIVIVVLGFLAIVVLTSKTDSELLDEGVKQLKAGRFKTVKAIMEDLQRRDSEEASRSADLLSGMIDVDLENYDRAIDRLAAAREYPATQNQAWLTTGEALFQSDRPSEATRAILVALDLDPNQVEAHRMLSVIYYDLGTMDKAITHLNEVARLDPTDARPWRLIGLIMKDYERYTDAVPAYQTALELCSAMVLGEEISVELAECHVQLHQYKDANTLLKTLNNQTPKVTALKARCAFAAGQFDEARRLADEAVKMESGQLDALRVLADVCLQNDELAEAIQLLKRILDSDYDDLESRNKLSQALRQTGDTNSADAESELLITVRGLRTEWAKLHQRALHDDDNAELRYRLGNLALELKHRDLAVTWFRATLAIDPDHNAARESMTKLFSTRSP